MTCKITSEPRTIKKTVVTYYELLFSISYSLKDDDLDVVLPIQAVVRLKDDSPIMASPKPQGSLCDIDIWVKNKSTYTLRLV